MPAPWPLDCPAEEVLLAFGLGALEAAARGQVIEHLDRCPVCREVVVAVAHADEPAAGAAGAPPRIGRYPIVRAVGAGAMGVVFAARDPELDREVAIKLLRRSIGGADDDARLEQRLLGEARALARLAHPNVVAVYEVGRHDGELYLAMELVPGPTLTRWLAEAPRGWREVVALFLQAGRGLAAAHAAGIIHRDVKPDNVLVGPDGRARVTDFGLASGTLAPSAAAPPADVALTVTGALAGTPAFMAPEVLRGGAADARSDQFAFAVAMWSALFGVRPFAGDDLPALVRALDAGRPRDGRRRRGAGPVRAVLRRALAVDPAARWPSVAALVDELERVTTRRPARRAAAVAAIALVAGAALALGWTRARPGATCAVDPRAAALWDAGVAARIEARFREVAPGRVPAVARDLTPAIQAWLTRWTGARTAACALGGEVGAARASCLDLQLTQAEAVVRLLGQADADMASGAVLAMRQLPDPGGCVPLPGGPAVDGGVGAVVLRTQLAEARALGQVGRFAEAARAAAAVAAAARVQALDGVRLEAMLVQGEAERDAGAARGAAATLDAATALAIARGDERALAAAAIHLVSVNADLGHLDALALAATVAEAALHRAGDDPVLAAWLQQGRCRAGWRRGGDPAPAIADCVEAGRRWRALYGPGADAYVENQLGILAYGAGDYQRALEHFRAFEAGTRRTRGDDFPNVDTARVNAAAALVKLGRSAEAEPVFRELIARRDWPSAWDGLGQALRARGALAEAVDAFRHAADQIAALGLAASDECDSRLSVVEVELARGRRDDARAALAQAVAPCGRGAGAATDARLAAVQAALR